MKNFTLKRSTDNVIDLIWVWYLSFFYFQSREDEWKVREESKRGREEESPVVQSLMERRVGKVGIGERRKV